MPVEGMIHFCSNLNVYEIIENLEPQLIFKKSCKFKVLRLQLLCLARLGSWQKMPMNVKFETLYSCIALNITFYLN